MTLVTPSIRALTPVISHSGDSGWIGYLRFSPLAAGPRTFSLFTIVYRSHRQALGMPFRFICKRHSVVSTVNRLCTVLQIIVLERQICCCSKSSMITGFWSPVGGLVFYDTGQVANQASDLDFTRIRHSFGFGLSFWAAEKQSFKIYVGLGSCEGTHPYFGIPKF
jgi:hypothetical protein